MDKLTITSDLKILAQKVYDKLGTGHTEYIYHRAFEIELRSKNYKYEFEKRVIISYTDDDGISYTLGEERIDLYIHGMDVIIELKAIVNPPKETEIAQINKYYRELVKMGVTPKLGIIINFPQVGTKPVDKNINFVCIDFENYIK